MNDIINLLPQSPEMMLQSRNAKRYMLNLTGRFYGELSAALTCFFISQELGKFDLKTSDDMLATNQEFTSEYSIGDVKQFLQKIKVLKNKSVRAGNDFQNKVKEQTLHEFLDDAGLLLEIPKDFLSLTKMYMLSKFKSFEEQGLKRTLGISAWFSKKLIHKYRVELKMFSRHFISQLTEQAPAMGDQPIDCKQFV